MWLLARELAALGSEQCVVTTADSELARRLSADGVNVRPAEWHIGLDPRALGALWRELHRGGPALLHAHDAHAVTLAGVCAAATGNAFVATRRVDFHLHRRGFWARADRIIAISSAIARVLEQDGIEPGRIAVVHSGIALEDARAATPLGIREQLGIAPDTKLAVNVAALVPHKDHATLFEAARLVAPHAPALHWVIAGEGKLRADLERRLDALALRNRVHLIGHLTDPLRLIADADLFVMSSREEGLGTSVLDAMALGIPVASTSAGGLPEMLSGGAGLLTPPGDAAALAAAVVAILEDTTLRETLQKTAAATVSRFHARRMAEQVQSVYRSCIYRPDRS